MPKPTVVKGQDATGRFYFSYDEKIRASGNTVDIHLVLTRENKSIGTILFRERWITGSINVPHKGPKGWARYLEKNLDKILAKAILYYSQKYHTPVELVSIEGWRIKKRRIHKPVNIKRPPIRKNFKVLSDSETKTISIYLPDSRTA